MGIVAGISCGEIVGSNSLWENSLFVFLFNLFIFNNFEIYSQPNKFFNNFVLLHNGGDLLSLWTSNFVSRLLRLVNKDKHLVVPS